MKTVKFTLKKEKITSASIRQQKGSLNLGGEATSRGVAFDTGI
jgi:hypothetical protein